MCALEDDARRPVDDLAVGPAHHAGDGHGTFPVPDEEHPGIDLPLRPVEGREGQRFVRGADVDAGPSQPVEVERVHRLAHFEQQVVRDVDDVVDRTDPAEGEAPPHPVRGRGDGHAGDRPGRVPRAQVRVGDVDPHQIPDRFPLFREGDVGKNDPLPGDGGELARHAEHAQAVAPVRRDLDLEEPVGKPERVGKRFAGSRIFRKDHDPRGRLGELQLQLRAEHPLGRLPADLRFPDFHAVGKPRADLRQRHRVPGLHVPRAADDPERGRPVGHPAQG